MEKVIVSKEVADAIEMYIGECTTVMKRSLEDAKAVLAAEHYGQDWRKYEIGQYTALNGIETHELMTALVVGYETEKTPEQELASWYLALNQTWGFHLDGEVEAKIAVETIEKTLNLLGIRIEGVNA